MEVSEDFIKAMDLYRIPKKGAGLIEASSENVMVFSEKMLGIKPYSWQVWLLNQLQASVNDKNFQKEFVALTSRQIGKSTLIAIFSLWACIFNKYPGGVGNNTVAIITSASDVQAKKLLGDMRKMIRAGDRHMAETYLEPDGSPVFGKEFFSGLLSEEDPNNTTTISFMEYKKDVHGSLLRDSKLGPVIKSYPPTSSILGETASIVIIDEAGMTDRITDEFFYDYIYPVGNKTNAVRLYTSTPWVSSGFFYNMVDPDSKKSLDIKPTVALFTIDAISREDPGMYNSIKNKTIKQLESDGKLDEVQRAYYCQFVKSDTSYFNPVKVIEAFDQKYEMIDSFSSECDMGIDFGGQTTSKSVITITEMNKNGDIRRLFKKVYPVGKDLGLMQDIIDLRKKFPKLQRIIPDDCPQGDFFTREMKEKGWPVFPMNFKSDKVKKYSAFRGALNRGKIKSFEDPDLRTEMLALQMEQGERSLKIKHAPNYTDDEIDSFVMSTYFMVQEEGGLKTFSFDNE
jgi:hypothetical protein